MFVSGVIELPNSIASSIEVPINIKQEFIRCILRNEPFIFEKEIHNFLCRFTSPNASDYKALFSIKDETYEDCLLVTFLESVRCDGRLVYERDPKLSFNERLEKLMTALGTSAAIPLIIYESIQFIRLFFGLLKEAYSTDFFTKTQCGEISLST